jgi:uncharacterized protein (TIGR03083 family)
VADLGTVYRDTRERITGLVADLDPAAAATVVPFCPAWTVKDTLAHLSGVIGDILAGRLDGVATDPWTAAQVEARRSWPLAEVVEEWTSQAPQVEAVLADFPTDPVRQLIADATTHEHDLRHALGRPGARDTESVQVAAGWIAEVFRPAGMPRLRVRLDDGDRDAGDGDGDGPPPVTVTVSSFEFLRARIGRRTLDQIAAFDWSADPAPYLPHFVVFTPPPAPIAE